MSVRSAAVAGQFYPADPRTLAAAVDAYLEAVPPRGDPRSPKGVIAPHAGYIYSGPTAGHAFAALAGAGEAVERFVVVGPSHRVPVRGLAIPEADEFSTPLGKVRVDDELCRLLEELPQVTVDARAHRWEHSVEVELPFLQQLFPEAAIVPLVVGSARAAEVAEALSVAWGDTETRIVVSTDLSHYLSYERAVAVDRETAETIASGSGVLTDDRACGARAVNGVLALAPRLGLRIELLDLRNSGDTAGDRERVVGYGAFAFYES